MIYDKLKIKKNVVLFFRKRNENFFSIENVFNTLFPDLSKLNNIEIFELPFFNSNILNLLKNIIFAKKHSGCINHITGDVHYIALGLSKSNTILTIHDIESLLKGNPVKRFIHKLFWIKIPIRHVKYVTVISNATKTKLLEQVTVNPEKIIVIPNCVFPKFTFSSYIFNNSCPTILQVGVTQNKNLESLSYALVGINCKLVILGNLNPSQIVLLNKLHIVYENYSNLSQNDVVELYRKCDLVTLISFYEGFGLPIIEAQATGRPVITSNISSMPEVAGNGALLVNPYDISEIRNAITDIINKPYLREELIKNGLENIKRFRPEEIAKKYSELYVKVYEESIKKQSVDK
jgi:glycosyltransferase involved in cell wall biosynthesis